jgi:hypothetical protein
LNILLWVLQILLAFHTAVGALWKFSHSPEQTMPSLAAIPEGVWLAMSVLELLCCLALFLPAFSKSLGKWVPVAASFIVAEMLFVNVVHLYSGDANRGPIIYWFVVAAVSAFIAYGRFVLKPIVQA